MSAAPTRVPLSSSVASHLTAHDPDVRPWAKCLGGKSKLVPELIRRIPKTFGAYYEPFVGGGALYFALQPKKAFLGDANPHLIRAYQVIRDNVESLIRELGRSRYTNSEEAYYKLRPKLFANLTITAAAEFIYVNRTSFNGVFRVNQTTGKFNVPFAYYKNPTICDADNLRACAKVLCNAHIYNQDFEKTLSNARAGDFVYADPPYWPVSATANFRGYTSSGFGPDDQVRLRDVALRLKKKGVCVVLSNADVPPVRELYKKGFKIERVEMARAINSVGTGRGKVGELIIY